MNVSVLFILQNKNIIIKYINFGIDNDKKIKIEEIKTENHNQIVCLFKDTDILKREVTDSKTLINSTAKRFKLLFELR